MDDDDDDVVVRKKKSRKIKTIVESDEEEDSVEAEFDVVMCHELPNTEIYRFHFPDRKKDAFDLERNPRVRYKKNVKLENLQMELRLAPDVQSGSFDKVKAERFATMTLANVKSESNIAATKFDEVYEGRSYVKDDYVQFAVGYFKGGMCRIKKLLSKTILKFFFPGVLYLTPIAGTFEMHLSLSHLNNTNRVGCEDDGEGTGESDTESSRKDAKQIRVKFARTETERQKKRREASALHREKLIASDSWIPMEDPLVHGRLAQMTPSLSNKSDIFEEVTTRDLVGRGIICNVQEQIDLTSSENLVSQQQIREMPVHLQVKAQLLKTRVIRTDDLARLVNLSITRHELFQHLQQCARLVQGVWVLQSEHLFHDLTMAHSNTIGKLDQHRAELWRCARDLALCILDADQPVTRALLTKCFKINSKDAEDILSTFAVPGNKTWKLRIEPDYVFLESPENASIVLEERRYWIKRWEGLRKMIDATLSPPSPPRARKNDGNKPTRVSTRSRKSSNRVHFSST
ncbi:Sin-like protein region [Dictyocaulus viviparus]|uniref:Sin-like protein region n=1 Tax=Dictyocaulus viviparus TaxID=29172 RepID=A0A0D8XNN0_DICVI|nr:Sin-like protein region [Dictyocaulus viviparus]